MELTSESTARVLDIGRMSIPQEKTLLRGVWYIEKYCKAQYYLRGCVRR